MASSDEDEDFKAAIAMSLASTQQEAAANTNASPTSSIAGLDRKAMEAERLARLSSRKRDRSISPPPLQSSRKVPKLDESTTTLSSGARLTMFSSIVDQDQSTRKSPIANKANASMKKEVITIKDESDDESTIKAPKLGPGDLLYPNGVVKNTWAFRHARTDNDIKLEEVLEASTLRTAVISAFQWDVDWVLSKLRVPSNGGTTKCVFVMQAKEEELRQQMIKETENMRSFLRLCFPPMIGQTYCMHSKLMLLFHPNKLRVAIPTANLLNFDWGETGVMENSVFMIDLPRLPEGSKTELEDLTSFGQELLYFMEKQTLDQDIRSGVLNFDFTATANMAFVHTVGGVSYRHNAPRTGLPGLANAIRTLGLQTSDLEIDFAASSIGSLNDDFLRNVQAAAKGTDMIARAENHTTKSKADFFKPASSKTAANPAAPKPASIRDQFRIYFPTEQTVRTSTAKAVGTICLSRKWYENMPFPRACFRDYRSTRKGLLSHNKILFARGKQTIEEPDSTSNAKTKAKAKELMEKDVAWVYVGSSNMSESAWGKLSFDKKDKAWKTICRNWECGVVLPVPAHKIDSTIKQEELTRGRRLGSGIKKEVKEEVKAKVKKEKIEGEDSDTETETESEADEGGDGKGEEEKKGIVGMDVFTGFVDPPFEIPGEVYGEREPWYFQEPH